jgi:outer membrane protein assembly factor BamB
MLRIGMLTGLVCLGSFQLLHAAGEWPQWRGPNRDGRLVQPSLELNWKQRQPSHLWTIDGMGEGYASVSVVDGRLYTTGNFPDGQGVVCVDLASRERMWATRLTDQPPRHSYPGSRCTPTIDGEFCYAITSDGQIACLKIADGDVVWKREMRGREWRGRMMSGWGYSESPLVDGDRVLCTPGGDNAMIVALDKRTGEEIWRSAVPKLGENGKDGAGYSSIVISEGAGVKQYVQVIGRGVIGVRAEDGQFLWGYNRVANGTANIPTPICTGDYVFASTGYGAGAVLLKLSRRGDGVRAEEQYFLDGGTFQNHHGGMILDGEYVYTGHRHGRGFPICLHLPTGEIRWGGDIRPEGSGSAAITQVNDQIIFRYQDGKVVLIGATPDGYRLNGQFMPEYQEKQSWAHPVVVGDKLYLREQDKLMCYQL